MKMREEFSAKTLVTLPRNLCIFTESKYPEKHLIYSENYFTHADGPRDGCQWGWRLRGDQSPDSSTAGSAIWVQSDENRIPNDSTRPWAFVWRSSRELLLPGVLCDGTFFKHICIGFFWIRLFCKYVILWLQTFINEYFHGTLTSISAKTATLVLRQH